MMLAHAAATAKIVNISLSMMSFPLPQMVMVMTENILSSTFQMREENRLFFFSESYSIIWFEYILTTIFNDIYNKHK